MKRTPRKTECGLHLAAFLIPCTVYLLTLFLLDACPFGENSLIISDANWQYLDFASYWKSVLTGENSFFYTFSKTLGGDGLNLAAYYLLSPFNLIFLLSNTENLPLLYTIVMILKVSCCGLSFFHVSSRFYGCKPSQLLFSTAYALMAYNVVYAWNVMWLDGILILPLLVLGLYRLAQDQKTAMYILSLMYALATNFYIGYMLCIAAVIFFIAMLALQTAPWREKNRTLLRFGTASLIGGFGTAFLWLPAFLSITGERSQTNAFEITFERSFGLLRFPSKLFCGAASPQDIMGGLPNIFCGTAILLLVVLFFLNKKIPMKEKLTAGAVLCVFFVSFLFLLPNTVWHGFSPTNSFNFRYSFLFSFVLIVIAQYQFSRRESLSPKLVLPAAALLLAFLSVSLLNKPNYLQTGDILITLCILAVCALCQSAGVKQKKGGILLFCAAGILELALNCCISWQAITDNDWMLNTREFSEFVCSTGAAVDYVKESDSGFYRMEKDFYRTKNDPAMFHYSGLSHFSSTEPVFVKTFARNMGFPTEYDFSSAYTTGSTADTDALLGVRYLLSKEDIRDTKPYTYVTTVDGINIYRNGNALPVAFLSSGAVTSVSTSEENKFQLHNAVWRGLTADDRDIFREADFSVHTENLTITQSEDGSTVYTKTDPDAASSVCYTVTVTSSQPLYFFFSAPDMQKVDIFINGQNHGLYFDEFSWNMDCAGSFTPGETVLIELRPQEAGMTVTQAYFFYENTGILEEMAAGINQQDMELAHISDTHLEGSFTAGSGQLLLFTIPYNEGWTLQIDGGEVPCQKVLDTFLAAEVSPGAHTFTLRYAPKGFSIGCCLTIAALGTSCAWYCLRKKQGIK